MSLLLNPASMFQSAHNWLTLVELFCDPLLGSGFWIQRLSHKVSESLFTAAHGSSSFLQLRHAITLSYPQCGFQGFSDIGPFN